MKIKQIHCKLCNSPLVSYLLQGSVYKFACGARECVDGRKSLGIRPMACRIIESLGGYKPKFEDKGQLEIPFPESKKKGKK